MRILVVEDERKVAAFVRQGLVEEGHAVEVAADGEAALDAVAAGPPYDLIVLDVMLPRRDGLSVLRTLRARRIQARAIRPAAAKTATEARIIRIKITAIAEPSAQFWAMLNWLATSAPTM